MQSEIFHTMLNEYCQLLSSRALARNTERAYISRVTQFLLFVEKTGDAHRFVAEEREAAAMLGQYQTYLRELGSTIASMNAVWTAIEQFLDYFGIHRPLIYRDSVEGRSKKILSGAKQQCLMQAVERESLLQHRAILTCFLYCGLRLSECSWLDIEHVGIDESGGSLIVGRGYIKRALALGNAREAVNAWLIERRLRGLPDSGPLFVNQRGERLVHTGLDRIVRVTGRRAGLEVSAQLLRRTYMHNMLTIVDDAHVVAALTGTRPDSFSTWTGA